MGHRYPAQLMSLLFNRPHAVGRARFSISGYSEEGSTTTPWMMLKVNKCGRFDVAGKALEYGAFLSSRTQIGADDGAVVMNYTTTDNIVGLEKRHRVGKVVAQAHQRMANYVHKDRVYEKYAMDTQQGTFRASYLVGAGADEDLGRSSRDWRGHDPSRGLGERAGDSLCVLRGGLCNASVFVLASSAEEI